MPLLKATLEQESASLETTRTTALLLIPELGLVTEGIMHDNLNTCGNFAINHPPSDNGGKNIKAMGYILVQ